MTSPTVEQPDLEAWINTAMEQAQVFASAWSLVGGCFDTGFALTDAEQAKAELRAMLYTRPQGGQEPVAWETVHHAVVAAINKCKTASGAHRTIGMFVNPAQITHDAFEAGGVLPRQKPLTDDEIIDIGNEVHRAMPADADDQVELLEIVRAVEEHHEIRSKND